MFCLSLEAVLQCSRGFNVSSLAGRSLPNTMSVFLVSHHEARHHNALTSSSSANHELMQDLRATCHELGKYGCAPNLHENHKRDIKQGYVSVPSVND